MKHIKIQGIFGILFLCLSMAACTPKPETTARDFVNAMTRTDFDKAKELCTIETQHNIDFFAVLIGNQKEEVRNTPVKFEIDKSISSVNNDTVQIIGRLYGEEGTIPLKKIDLQIIKHDNKWLVNYNKQGY